MARVMARVESQADSGDDSPSNITTATRIVTRSAPQPISILGIIAVPIRQLDLYSKVGSLTPQCLSLSNGLEYARSP
ncbi:hypothetical protein FE257_004214 [Aspergillus nanangensis]|uniref:Uncharacterized protein n=1 Tax=Aspergillus nanangensis TaxID=2582783 RepID=A0AAD4GXA5_ASPNN|nr:hypothetical protein FE257_004214 [Aspergillus nanangensis]